jgi:threonine synthase
MACRANYASTSNILLCPKCGGILDVEYDLATVQAAFTKESLKTEVRSLWRYAELLPVKRTDCVVSLGEGFTPLKRSSNYAKTAGITDLTFKLDYMNPTASFKDRGSTVIVSKLKEWGITSAMDDSSGNAGVSLAAYCASAGIECTVYVPASVPAEKLIQAQIYGAKIEKVPGSRTDVTKVAVARSKSSAAYYASHNMSPFFLEGMKTTAFEAAEMLSWEMPDHMIFPVGGGTLIAGAWKGFEELMQLGQIHDAPKLHAAQSEACMPIVEAYRKGSMHVEPVSERETVAGGIRITNPARGMQVLQALRSSRGAAVAVSDNAILKHQRLLAMKEGIFAEPTSCAALAALETLLDDGTIHRDESVLIPLTGFGLKDTKNAARSLELARNLERWNGIS